MFSIRGKGFMNFPPRRRLAPKSGGLPKAMVDKVQLMLEILHDFIYQNMPKSRNYGSKNIHRYTCIYTHIYEVIKDLHHQQYVLSECSWTLPQD